MKKIITFLLLISFLTSLNAAQGVWERPNLFVDTSIVPREHRTKEAYVLRRLNNLLKNENIVELPEFMNLLKRVNIDIFVCLFKNFHRYECCDFRATFFFLLEQKDIDLPKVFLKEFIKQTSGYYDLNDEWLDFFQEVLLIIDPSLF